MKKHPGLFFVAVMAAGIAVLQTAQAATIRLQDGAVLEGDVLQVDDEGVVVQLPRERVAAVNGQPLPVPLTPGAAAPAVTVTDVSGQAHVIGGPTGRVTVLHFWVHWCPHCRSDAPHIQRLHDRFRDDPRVQVLTVNLDEQRAEADQFIQEHHVTYPVIIAAGQREADLMQRYQVNGFPVTYLIDGRGVIRRKVYGSFVESRVDLGAEVEALLSPPHVPVTQP